MSGSRLAAFDWLRVIATVLVVHHHASLAYLGSAQRRWYVLDEPGTIVFDALVRVVDPFFMPAFFLMAGYLCARALGSPTGCRGYVGRRLVRLGLPFVVGVLVLVPVLTYVRRLDQQDPSSVTEGLVAYWQHDYLGGDWRAGYLWFLSLLLVFSLVAAGLGRRWPGIVRPAPPRERRSPRWTHVAVFVVLVAAGQLVASQFFGEYEWVEWVGTGVLTFQPSRLASFAMSFVAGAYGWRHQWSWTEAPWAQAKLALPLGGLVVVAQIGFSYAWYAEVPGSLVLEAANALLYAITSALLLAAGISCSGLAVSSRGTPSIVKRISSASYAIYLLHLPLVVTAQYWLQHWRTSPFVKDFVVLVIAATLTFVAADLLIRRVALARRLLA